MLYVRRRLTWLMLASLFVAGGCADRAENATGQSALDRQLDRTMRADSAPSTPANARTEPRPAAPRREAPTRPAARPAPVLQAAEQAASPSAAPAPRTAPTEQATPAQRPTPVAQSSASAPQATAQAGTEAAETAPPTSAPVPRARAPRTVMMTVPIGTVLSVSLDQELSTQDNRAGDTFTTTLREPFVDPSGTVLLPAGAIVQGRVTAAQQSTRVGRTAVLKLAFDSISFAGRSYPLSATVMEANPERRSRSSTTETAGKIAAGAAAGALLGRILGKDTKSTVAGAAMGAAAGTAIALGTQDVDAVLPKDSPMVIRLDRPVAVEVMVR